MENPNGGKTGKTYTFSLFHISGVDSFDQLNIFYILKIALYLIIHIIFSYFS